MKRIGMLLVLFAALLLPCGAAEKKTSGSCGVNISWGLEDGVLTISGTGEMHNYIEHAPWWDSRDEITALVLEPGAYPSALVLANFKDKDVDTLLDLMKQAQVNIPLKAVVTPANRSWVFGDLLAHLQEEHTAFTAAKENQTR